MWEDLCWEASTCSSGGACTSKLFKIYLLAIQLFLTAAEAFKYKFFQWPCNGNLLMLLGQSCISKHVIYFQKGNYRSDTLLLTFQQAFWVADSNSKWILAPDFPEPSFDMFCRFFYILNLPKYFQFCFKDYCFLLLLLFQIPIYSIFQRFRTGTQAENEKQ